MHIKINRRMTEVFDASESPFGNYVQKRNMVEAVIVEDDAVVRKVAEKEAEKKRTNAGSPIRRGTRYSV